jgi:serine/threonine protein kinase
MLPLQSEEKEKWTLQAIPAGTRIGRYSLGRKIDQGGMAEVYLADTLGELDFKKQVVLKIVLPNLASDEQYMKMFKEEARLASMLCHPNVVQVLDFGRYNDRYYLAMEYIHGVSLRRLRGRCRHLGEDVPPIMAAVFCADVAKALHYVHSFKLVHRDVSPHNILLSAEGAVKLTDFGIAKAATSNTQSGVIKGKFAYLSPEQSVADPVDGRSDIFSLGTVYWELLTGKSLFGGKGDLEVLNAVRRCVVPSPRDYRPDIPEELAVVARKALARSPSDRYQTGAEFELALRTSIVAKPRRPEETSVKDYLLAKFPPKDNFLSTIEPSVIESGIPKLALIPAEPSKAPTKRLLPISTAPRLVVELSGEPEDWPTVPAYVLENPGRTTISLPRARDLIAPLTDWVQVNDNAPSPVNGALRSVPDESPSMLDLSLEVIEETPLARPAPRIGRQEFTSSSVPRPPRRHFRLVAVVAFIAVAGLGVSAGTLWFSKAPVRAAPPDVSGPTKPETAPSKSASDARLPAPQTSQRDVIPSSFRWPRLNADPILLTIPVGGLFMIVVGLWRWVYERRSNARARRLRGARTPVTPGNQAY